jgi:hypothetical protein
MYAVYVHCAYEEYGGVYAPFRMSLMVRHGAMIISVISISMHGYSELDVTFMDDKKWEWGKRGAGGHKKWLLALEHLMCDSVFFWRGGDSFSGIF